MVLVLCIMKLELHVLLRLCLNEISVYVEHVKVCNVMNEGLDIYRIEYKWNDAYVQGVFTCTHTLSLELMDESKLSQKG